MLKSAFFFFFGCARWLTGLVPQSGVNLGHCRERWPQLLNNHGVAESDITDIELNWTTELSGKPPNTTAQIKGDERRKKNVYVIHTHISVGKKEEHITYDITGYYPHFYMVFTNHYSVCISFCNPFQIPGPQYHFRVSFYSLVVK